MKTNADVTKRLHEIMNSNNSNLIATLQDWFAFVDKTEDLHHRAFQLRWHEEGIKKEIYITENFDIPYCDLSNIILERLVHEHIFDEELIAYPFRQNHQELFYLLKNIVFLLFSDFTLLSRRQHLVFGNETINILFLGNIEVYTLPFLLISNYFPKIRIFVALDKNALLIINEHVYFRYGLFFDGEEVSLVDSTDNPVEVYYIYNKTKKADPELHGLKIPLSGDPHFENLVANKILTHKVVHKAGLARPKCIFFVPQAFTTTVPSQLVDELNLFNDNDIYQLNGNMNAIKKIIDTALYQFDVENIVVKPNLGTKGQDVDFFINQTLPHKMLGHRKRAVDAIYHILASGDGVVVEERIFSPDSGKSVIRAIGISDLLQPMTGLDLVLDQNYQPIFLEANGNRSAGLNWLLKFGQKEAVQKALNCMIRAAQAYKDGNEQERPNSVECAGFFVKMWTEEVNKPVNTTLGAITQSWAQWAENNVPHDISGRVTLNIEQLVVTSFKVLQEVAISLS